MYICLLHRENASPTCPECSGHIPPLRAPRRPNAEAFAQFRKSVGFQLNFVLYSGLDVEKAIDNICRAAETLISD